MDSLDHLIVSWGAIIFMGLYPLKKSLYLLGLMLGVTFINYSLAASGSIQYNNVGWMISYPLFILAIRERMISKDVNIQVKFEKMIAIIFGDIASALSHGADAFLLFANLTTEAGLVEHQRDVWRPHNLWHTPVFAIIASVAAMFCIFAFFDWYANRTKDQMWKFRTPLPMLMLAFFIAYYLHILGDTMTYEFPVYWFWPFSDFNISYYATANNGITVTCPPENPDCYVYYYAMPVFAWTWALLAVMMKVGSRQTVRKEFQE